MSNSNNADQYMTILEAPIVAPLGKVNGKITGLAVETGTDGEGKAFKRLKLVGELNEKNEAGEQFKGSRVWNLLGRGGKDFCKEVSAFTTTKITTNDLRQFNKSVLINKPAVFEVKERREGRKSVLFFGAFLPAESEAKS